MKDRRHIGTSDTSPKGPLTELSLELTLPEQERYFDAPLQFKAPSLETLAVTANRLLKFEFPPSRNPSVYERLLKTHLHAPGLSKRLMEELPLFLLERLYTAIWRNSLPSESPPQDWSAWNRLLALLLLAEQLIEFQAEAWVGQDIALLGKQAHPSLPSYYFNGQMDRDTLLTILSRNQYQTEDTQHAPEADLLNAYLIDRTLTEPLPWVQLLDNLPEETLRQYPRLHRVGLIYQALRQDSRHTELLAMPSLEALPVLQTLLQRDWTVFSKQSNRSRPVRILVLVEGETEKLLLPVFAETMQLNFHELGVYVLPAGGKNQMLALYQKFKPVLNVPIYIILDRDAAETAQALRQILRPGDAIHELPEGEFEDTYELSLILQTLNRFYEPYPRLNTQGYQSYLEPPAEGGAGFIAPVGRVQELKLIWKALDLGAFDKTLFATQLAETLRLHGGQPPEPLQRLIRHILEIRAHALAD